MSNDLALRYPDAPSAPIAADLLAAARDLLARDRSPVLRVAPSTPPAMREAMLSALADEGVPHVARYAALVRDRVMREQDCARVLDCQRAVAQGLLDAVHDLAEYTPDPVDGLFDFFSRVPETLRPRRGAPVSALTGRPRGAGDCDDLTVLAVSLLRAAGLRARPDWIDQPGAFLNHVSSIVYLPSLAHPSGDPAWAEPTIEGARVGEHPYRVVERLGHGPRIFGETPMQKPTARRPASPLATPARRAIPLPSAAPVRPGGAVARPAASRTSPAGHTPHLTLAPAGATAERIVRVVPVPPPGARLYADDGRGRTVDLTGTGTVSAAGDALLVTVPAWAVRLSAEGREGTARVDLAVRPAGLPGELVALTITGTGNDAPLRITQNGLSIISTARPDGQPALTLRNGIVLGATDGVPVRVRVGDWREREFDVVATNGEARIDSTLRRVRWPSLTPYARILLPNGNDATTQALPDGTPARWEGRDWISGIPGSAEVLTVVRPDGTRVPLTVPPVAEGEREVVLRETPLAVFGATPGLAIPSRPTRPALTLTGGPMTLGNVGGGTGAGSGGGGGGESSAPGMVNVRLRGATRAANGRPVERVLVNNADGTAASLASGDAARWDGADWLFGLASTIRTVRVVRADGSMIDLPVPAGVGEVLVTLPAPPAPVPLTLRLRALPPSSRVFVGDIDATTSPVSVPPGGWSGNVWSIGVPRGTRAVTVRYPDGTTRELDVPAVASGTNEVTIDVPAATPEALPPYLTLRVRNARADASVARPTFVVFAGDAVATDYAQPSGASAGWDGNDWLLGLPRATRSVRVRYPSGSFGTFTLAVPEASTREWSIEPPSDLLAVVAGDGGAPETYASVDSLGNTRVWMISPPAGTYAVAIGTSQPGAALETRRLEGVTTQMRLGAPPPSADGLIAANYSAIPATWVTEARLPDGPTSAWHTQRVEVVLPTGERLPVTLSPVPTDGVFNVDLSAYPGARPTTSGIDHAGADAGSGGFGLGTLALGAAAIGAAVWGVRRYTRTGRADASRSNPSHVTRRARRRAHR